LACFLAGRVDHIANNGVINSISDKNYRISPKELYDEASCSTFRHVGPAKLPTR